MGAPPRPIHQFPHPGKHVSSGVVVATMGFLIWMVRGNERRFVGRMLEEKLG